MDNILTQSVKNTIAYFQVFNYFLNIEGLHEFLHSSTHVSIHELVKQIETENREVNGYLISNQELVKKTRRWAKSRRQKIKLQQEKFQASVKKMELAKKTARLLAKIPSVKLLAVSGNLAMMQADAPDDIDLFCITSRGTVWMTRLLASLLLVILGKKRMFGDRQVKNKICLNFLIDEDHLEMKKKNIFTAHEIVQMKVLFDKDNTCQKFLEKNSWVEKHLANWWQIHFSSKSQTSLFEGISDESFVEKITLSIFRFFEPVARFIQFEYMKRRITREIIKDGVLMFHPHDASRTVISKYRRLSSL